MDRLAVQGALSLAGDGERRIRWPCRDQQVLPSAKRAQHRGRNRLVAASSRLGPAPRPLSPSHWCLACRSHGGPTPGRFPASGQSRSPAYPPVCPFSSRSTSSATRSPSSSSGLLRRGQTGEQSRRTPLNLKLRLLAGVSVSQSSTPRCTPPAALRVRTPGSVGRVPVLRHCACAAGWSWAVSPEPSRAPRRCALGSVCVRAPWLSWWWSSPLVSACARRVQLGREPQGRDRDLRSVHFLCQLAAINTERSRLTSTDHVYQTGGASGKEPACQCRRLKRHRFDPWVGKIPWRRA